MQARILTKDSDKEALIRRLSNEGRALMFFYEEEPEGDIRHERVSDSITVVHPPYDYGTLKRWLYLGDWQAIFPCNKEYQPFDTFKTKEADIKERMKEANVQLIVDSFHDDIEWKVIEET